ncbi:MAG: hypothetical protein MUO72_19575 [Bacteroidales bacterium]|nr:hypothetical protein [Bacteroidales bacterium]
MKSKIIIVLDFVVGCTNRAEIKKCKSVIQDNNKLISQAEYVIEKQEEIADKGRLIKSDNATYFTIQKNVDYENAVNVKANVEILKDNLNAINGFYNVLIKAHSKRLRTKQDIITDANNKILNAKNNMLKVTGGLSPKEYIYKDLPKELQ